jgi:hypothetical protein
MSANLTEMREVTAEEMQTVEGGSGMNDPAQMFQQILQQLTGRDYTGPTQPTLIHERPHAK